jgi:hypothetical protein
VASEQNVNGAARSASLPHPRNLGGRPTNEARLARRLATARKTAIVALLRVLEDPSSPGAVVVQAAGQLERLNALDQVAAGAVARLERLERELANLSASHRPIRGSIDDRGV